MKRNPLLLLSFCGALLLAVIFLPSQSTDSQKVEVFNPSDQGRAPLPFSSEVLTRHASVEETSTDVTSLSEQWSVIKPMLLVKKTRGVGIAMAMELRGLPNFFLDRIPLEMEENQEFANPFGHLMAVMLEGWLQIPGETEASFVSFLPDLFLQAEQSEDICQVAANAWRGRRLLNAEDLDLVLELRPENVDQSQFPWRVAFFLLTLEDTFHALMEGGDSGRVERFLEDPSHKVRLVAIRVLFDGKSSADWASIMGLLEKMDFADVVALAEWIATSQEPQVAGELLRMISSSMNATGGFLSAWAMLGGRDRSVLEWTLRSEFDFLTAEQTSEPPTGFLPIENVGELDFLYHEGSLRKEVMDAYFLNSLSKGEPMDAEMLNWLARLDQNPLTRGQAWRTLGRSPDDANLALVLDLFQEPGYLASLRLPGEDSDQRAAEYLIQYVSPRLDASERSLFLAQSQEMLLSAEERAALEKAFSN
ncbi:MAG: hypothetical protein COA70_13075 [Planctomycetota bacterium]|nr:MAG: hypothetical protein COA70_13075 [Planctomycetota bacterium]